MTGDPRRALAAAERAADWATAAAIHERDLGDLASAIACWRRVLAADPASAPAFDALERILSYDQRWPDLVALLEARLAIDPTSTRDLLGKLLAIYRDILQDDDLADATGRRLADLATGEG